MRRSVRNEVYIAAFSSIDARYDEQRIFVKRHIYRLYTAYQILIKRANPNYLSVRQACRPQGDDNANAVPPVRYLGHSC